MTNVCCLWEASMTASETTSLDRASWISCWPTGPSGQRPNSWGEVCSFLWMNRHNIYFVLQSSPQSAQYCQQCWNVPTNLHKVTRPERCCAKMIAISVMSPGGCDCQAPCVWGSDSKAPPMRHGVCKVCSAYASWRVVQ